MGSDHPADCVLNKAHRHKFLGHEFSTVI